MTLAAVIVWTIGDILALGILAVMALLLVCCLVKELACSAWNKIKGMFGRNDEGSVP